MAPDDDWLRFRPLLRLHVTRLRLGPMHQARFDVSDVVQEACLRAAAGAGGMRAKSEGEIVAWLKAVAGNVLIDMVRRQDAEKRDPRRERMIEATRDGGPMEAYLAASQPGPSTIAAKGEELLQLAAAVERLPEAEREAVVAHYLMELPLAESAARMGRSERAVAGLVFRGRKRLAELMKGDRP